MLKKPKPNPSKCTTNNPNPNPNPLKPPNNLPVDAQLESWVPSETFIDGQVLKLKARYGDIEANWEKTILNFKKELEEEERRLNELKSNPPSSSGGDNNGRAKFCVPLSRREMEKDFEDMGERRLPRKPKKRPKIVQNKLDTLFPGLWLTEIHADLYRVSESRKR